MIKSVKKKIKNEISIVASNLALLNNIKLTNININIQKPPKSDLGDISILIFELSKTLKLPIETISEEIIKVLKAKYEIKAMGPYLNIKIPRKEYIKNTIQMVNAQKDAYGASKYLDNKKIILEFSSPNTNKPLHVGHLRNDVIGESLSRILKTVGAKITKINLINDRGVHICKSMLAYKKFGNDITPEKAFKKGDHLIGDFYVKYNKYSQENENAEKEIQDLLLKWEQKDTSTIELWKKLNNWAIEGIKETYKITNTSFDKIYLESEIFEVGKNVVLEGLKKGFCYKREDGAICIDLPLGSGGKEDTTIKQKVLIRSNGTSIYLTQDLGNITVRTKEFNFEEMIYVVGSEQIQHFKSLFFVSEKLGISKNKKLIHLSHGMVNLIDGKMKSREGNVIDADNLILELMESIMPEITQKIENKDSAKKNALNIALGAIHYYLLKSAIHKDIVFNKKESLSFTGNSGPYIQYVGARINSILEKYNALSIPVMEKIDFELLKHEKEWEIIKIISELEENIIKAAKDLSPSILTSYTYSLAKHFSAYYQEVKVIDINNTDLTAARIEFLKAILQTIKNCMYLLNIPYMLKM
ncbi:arginine--tRNA ligase [Borreliella californiensis]|uniref:Arginine--tRNA ligase n=1 Tax=Borreliella californiensis TaxID=373543 RepID=A0A7W9ZM32_9SPIR|nr:arginine--tRNA ligase [Borreliella californiensis]MBB6212709.1 arginyl-tRNA synthetase [Borreliella californiensis]WKC91862.1 arginine--tRNA ligase [Borreliella californiensis]WNY70614.1 arginine--tRNA ligase [Borreliella californiensis]